VEFASDMLNLRREIDSLRAARTAMMNGLNQFNRELRKSTARKMSDMRHMLAKEFARARATRRAFSKHNRRMVDHLIAGFGTERSAARRNFMGKGA